MTFDEQLEEFSEQVYEDYAAAVPGSDEQKAALDAIIAHNNAKIGLIKEGNASYDSDARIEIEKIRVVEERHRLEFEKERMKSDRILKIVEIAVGATIGVATLACGIYQQQMLQAFSASETITLRDGWRFFPKPKTKI